MKFNKQRHTVIGQKRLKNELGKPGVSRSKAIQRVVWLQKHVSFPISTIDHRAHYIDDYNVLVYITLLLENITSLIIMCSLPHRESQRCWSSTKSAGRSTRSRIAESARKTRRCRQKTRCWSGLRPRERWVTSLWLKLGGMGVSLVYYVGNSIHGICI